MFIKVDSVYYYIVIKNKTITQIYYELISRMNKNRFSKQEKRYILSKIVEQIKCQD
jgi:hypothetical protein